MLLEFKVCQLREDSKMYRQLVEDPQKLNDFIVVGEELLGKDYDCFKVQQLEEEGICLIGGLMIDDTYLVKKEDLEIKHGFGVETTELEIPSEYLTMKIVETIQRLNVI